MKSVITQDEYIKAQLRLEKIIDLVNDDTPVGNPVLQELIEISDTIEAYEQEYFPLSC